MTVNIQSVIQALIKANDVAHADGGEPRRPLVTLSRDMGSHGDAIAQDLAARLGVKVYDKEILDAIAHQAGVNSALMKTLHERVSDASDAWLYALVTGKNVSREDYRRSLITAVRALYRTGGIVLGRGAHVILAGRDVLRIRITGSVDVCAQRVAQRQHIPLQDAVKLVRETNKRRATYVWETFKSRLNDPTNFDLVVNTDNFADYHTAVELIWGAIGALAKPTEKAPLAKAG
ncbi:MAG: AAA family ATPase [Magnetospiraceae bacterium]